MSTVPVRFRLGAEELLELGRSNQILIRERRPFLSGRHSLGNGESLGQLEILGNVAGFLANGLSFAFNSLGDIVNVPLNILSQGVDVTFGAMADLLSNIPVLGDLLAQILVLGGGLIKFGLSIPGLALHGLGNVLGGIGKALSSKGTSEENGKKVDGAKNEIVSKAPGAIKDNVKAILDASGISGSNLTPGVKSDGTPVAPPAGTASPSSASPPGSGTDLGQILAIGIPVAGVVALILVAS